MLQLQYLQHAQAAQQHAEPEAAQQLSLPLLSQRRCRAGLMAALCLANFALHSPGDWQVL